MTNNPFFIPLFLILSGGALTAAWSAWLFRPARSSFLPPRRRRAVPWSGWEVLGAFLVYFLAAGLALSLVASPGVKSVFRARELCAQLLGAAVGIVTAVGLPWLVSHTRPYQLGLSTERLGKNVFLGLLAVLCLLPLVMGCYMLIAELMRQVEIKPEEHPLSELGKSHPGVIEWILMTVSAAVAAPLIEELLARGLFQRWLTTRRDGWAIAVATALILSLLPHFGKIEAASKAHNWHDVLNHLQTTLFVIATVPPLLVVRRVVPSVTVGAVYGSSIAFAAAHASVWPSPIPLFVLAIGLGLLAERTQSLIPSIVAHSLFNGFNLLLLVLMPEKL